MRKLELAEGAMANELTLKGLNLNNNSDLTDQSIKALQNFASQVHSLRVLSIEKFAASHQGIIGLVKTLPYTRLVELNMSGIPLSYLCIEQICETLGK